MAYYVPKFAGCFGAGCSDLYPEATQQYLPGSGPSPFPSSPMPGIRVGVNVNAPGQDMIIPYEEPEKRGLPWWAWLAIGLLVMRIAKS